jgi:PBP1b-binding outer membrane lipoprotein LpoB
MIFRYPRTIMHRISMFAFVIAAALALSGCTVTLLSSYDETTDKNVTALQKKTEAHFVSLESSVNPPDCDYAKHQAFYDEAKVDVSAIEVRAAAIPKNDITTKQSKLLKDSLESLEELHKSGCISKEQIAPLREQFNSSFTAILKLELAKRRGESGNSNN